MLRNRNQDNEALAGVAALIVFIALVLVAAIASTVILDVTGELEQQASNTGEEAEGQLSSTLQIIEVTGGVNGTTQTVNNTTYTVSVAPGADPINLTQLTIEMTTNEQSVQLTAASNPNANNSNTGDFTITPIVSENNSNNILRRSQDRYKITIDHTQGNATITPNLNALEEGETVELVFESGQGGTRFYEFTVPSTLGTTQSRVTL